MSEGWEACVCDARQGSVQKRDRRFGVKLFPRKTAAFGVWRLFVLEGNVHRPNNESNIRLHNIKVWAPTSF